MSSWSLSRLSCRFTSLLLLIGLVVLCAGCGGGGSSVGLTAQPLNATVNVNSNFTFNATVTGTSNTAVTWLVQEGNSGGAITPAGVYTAPGVAGTYHVVVSSVADPSKTIVIPVVVQSANASGTVQ